MTKACALVLKFLIVFFGDNNGSVFFFVFFFISKTFQRFNVGFRRKSNDLFQICIPKYAVNE